MFQLHRRPLVAATAAWTAGSAAVMRYPSAPAALWLGSLLIAAGVLALFNREGNGSNGRRSLIAVLWAGFVLGGMYWTWTDGHNVSRLPQAMGRPSDQLAGIAVRAAGTIASPVERDGDKVSFRMKLNEIRESRGPATEAAREAEGAASGPQGETVQVQLKLAAESEIEIAEVWQRGDRIELAGTLEEPSAARNFGGFDYAKYLRNHRIHWLLKSAGASQAKVSPPSGLGRQLPLRWIDALRSRMGAELDGLFHERDAGYLKGLIIGMQDDLEPATYREFSKLGLTHILAISGMHVAVFVGSLLFLLGRLRLTRETSLVVALLLVPVYVLLTGAGPSVIRAGLMSMIGLYAARRGLLRDGLHLLCAAGLAMLLWNPYYLVDVGFQLSFLVTAGLLLLVPLAAPLFSPLPSRLASALAVTAVAQLVSFPLTIYYFNQFALLSFAANLVLVPFISFVVLPAGTAALLLAPVWRTGALVLAHLVHAMDQATFAVVGWCADLAGALVWPSPSPLWIAAYYGLLYSLLKSLNRWRAGSDQPPFDIDETRPLSPELLPELSIELSIERSIQSPIESSFERHRRAGGDRTRVFRLTASLLAASLAALLVFGYRTERLSAEGAVSFLDVGQGDSILIETPSGGHILVDGGGTVSFGNKEAWRARRDPYEVGRKALVPLLKKRGIHRLDAIILTHGDQDHAGGLQAVLEEMPVSALLFNGTLADTEAYRKLMRTAVDRNVRLYAVHQGMKLTPDEETALDFLGPDLTARDTAALPVRKEQNNLSVVFKLTMSGRSFMFTGDMEKEQEEAIVAAKTASAAPGTVPMEPIDVLKAAHHGSTTSSSEPWLRYWNPAAAVISVGASNTYGHPADEVLARMENAGMDIYRTDRMGEIQIRVNRDDSLAIRHKE